MLRLWGGVVFRLRRWVLAATAVFVVLAALWGTGVFGALSDEGFDDPGSEASRAARAAEEVLGGGHDLLVLVEHEEHTVDEPVFAGGVAQIVAALPADLVETSVGFAETGSEAFVSSDRHTTYVAVQVAEDTTDADYWHLVETYQAPHGFAVGFGGNLAMNADINAQVSKDIAQAEMISFPILLVLLLVVFGGVVAAGLPLAVGAVAILGAFTVLRVMTAVTDISVFSVNIVTMLGLGLAIDYALFVVGRFREELHRGGDVESALVTTMATAGRTIAVSGLTVAVALSSLLLFPQVFFRSMGLGGMAAVAVAMLTSLTALPAGLAVLGHRVDSWRVPRLNRRAARGRRSVERSGGWARVAGAVMARPWVYVAVIVPVLLILGSPFLRVEFGGVDHRALPEGTQSREVAETLLNDFPTSGEPIRLVLSGTSAETTAAFVDRLEQVEGVKGVTVAGDKGEEAVVDVTHGYEVYSASAKELVRDLRQIDPETGSALVTGTTAFLVDVLDSIGDQLPTMAAWVVCSTFLLLFLAFGSLLLPIKAIVMNLLSLTASFGALVWIFQDGNLAGTLGFTPTGTVEATQPILMLAIAFGLSMDYEVFLLSRVREQWDLTGDNRLAVATGLQRTGGLITSAALLMVVVVGAFSTSGITFIKMIGIGLALAIVIDATVVRGLLVPATMRLLGELNWWLPAFLDRLWRKVGIREYDGPPTAAIPEEDVEEPVGAIG
ncbi:MAG TPA: MMPL family transporter [Nocardioidaceae bacterium]|nr:MMPL family transporter [Nocardioidaceae bacterium]